MDWLARANRWAAELADTVFKEAELAELQFAAALAEASPAELVPRREVLVEASELQAPPRQQLTAARAAPPAGRVGP